MAVSPHAPSVHIPKMWQGARAKFFDIFFGSFSSKASEQDQTTTRPGAPQIQHHSSQNPGPEPSFGQVSFTIPRRSPSKSNPPCPSIFSSRSRHHTTCFQSPLSDNKNLQNSPANSTMPVENNSEAPMAASSDSSRVITLPIPPQALQPTANMLDFSPLNKSIASSSLEESDFLRDVWVDIKPTVLKHFDQYYVSDHSFLLTRWFSSHFFLHHFCPNYLFLNCFVFILSLVKAPFTITAINDSTTAQ
jgi:hypothetical protein